MQKVAKKEKMKLRGKKLCSYLNGKEIMEGIIGSVVHDSLSARQNEL